MSFKEFGDYDAVGLADLVRRKEVTPQQLFEEAIVRIDKIDPQLNAVVVRHYDYAQAQIERGLPDGPFTGVPFLMKDDQLLEGTRTTLGSRAYKNNIADHSRTLAKRFLAAGVSILGKTATPEFAMLPTTEAVLHGPTRNPWNLAHSAGGSSGGAAAAVAARIIPVAHASDGAGSTRIPSSACGVFGLKPTRARTPVGPDSGRPLAGFASALVTSVSVRDSAVMLDALSGPELTGLYHAPATELPFADEIEREPGQLRIAFTAVSPYGEAIDPEIEGAVHDVAALLEKSGHHVEETAPVLPSDPAEALETIISANIASYVRLGEQHFGRALTELDLELSTLAKARKGQKISATEYLAAEDAVFGIARALAEFFVGYDVFLSPTLCAPPARLGEFNSMTDELAFTDDKIRRYMPGTAMYNMSGQPAMSVPLAWNNAGLPLGMMFAGRFGDEATLLRLAAQLEQERPWRNKRPPVSA